MKKTLVASTICAGLMIAFSAGPAAADPLDVADPLVRLDGSGSDTTEVVMRALDAQIPNLGSWDISGPAWDSNGAANVGCEFVGRNAGSGAGRTSGPRGAGGARGAVAAAGDRGERGKSDEEQRQESVRAQSASPWTERRRRPGRPARAPMQAPAAALPGRRRVSPSPKRGSEAGSDPRFRGLRSRAGLIFHERMGDELLQD